MKNSMIFSEPLFMKKLLLLFLFALPGLSAFAQTQDPVEWTAVFKTTGEKEGEIVITGTVQKGWHTYSMRATDAGPIPTSIVFTESKDYALVGKLVESGATEELDAAFDARLYVFHDKAEFVQKVRLKSSATPTVPVSIEYMACNNMMCLPPKTATLQVKLQR
jgi:hypothetical protein